MRRAVKKTYLTSLYCFLLEVNLVAWQRIRHFRGVVVSVQDLNEHDRDVITVTGSGSDVTLCAHVQRVV